MPWLLVSPGHQQCRFRLRVGVVVTHALRGVASTYVIKTEENPANIILKLTNVNACVRDDITVFHLAADALALDLGICNGRQEINEEFVVAFDDGWEIDKSVARVEVAILTMPVSLNYGRPGWFHAQPREMSSPGWERCLDSRGSGFESILSSFFFFFFSNFCTLYST